MGRSRGRVHEGDRVRVFFGDSTAPGAAPCDGIVRFECVTVGGVFVELDAPAPADASHRLRANGGDRTVLAYHRECERVET